MAIDTAAKRAAAFNAFQLDLVLPIPDGTVGAGDRQHLLGFYSGIEAAPAPAPLYHQVVFSTDMTHGITTETDMAHAVTFETDMSHVVTFEAVNP